MKNDNSLIDLLVEKCKENGLLLYDSNLIDALRELDNQTIIQYLVKKNYILK